MAIYTVELDGKQFDIEGPDGATQDELYQAAIDSEQQKPTLEAPQLSTGLQAMSGAMSPVGPSLIPKEANAPYTTPTEAGAMLAEKTAEAGHPVLGTALYAVPRTAEIALESAIGGSGAKASSKGLPSVLRSSRTLGKELGQEMSSVGLKRGTEMVGEARSRNAILQLKEALSPLKNKPAKQVAQVFEPQGLVDKYDEVGRVLDHLKVARYGANPKELVAKSTIHELSAIKAKLGEALTEVAPNVGEKMGQLGMSLKRNQLIKSLATSPITKALGLGAAGTGAYKLFK